MKHPRLLFIASLLLFAACTKLPATPSEPTTLQPFNFGTPRSDGATQLAHHRTGVYVAGATQGKLHSTPQGEYDIFIRKYDASGALLWGRQFGTHDGDFPTGLANDSGDNVYIAGVTYGDLSGSKGGDDSFVRKYSSSGKPLWTVQFGTRGGDYTSGIAVHGSSVYVVGAIQNYNTGNNTGLSEKSPPTGKLFGRNRYADIHSLRIRPTSLKPLVGECLSLLGELEERCSQCRLTKAEVEGLAGARVGAGRLPVELVVRHCHINFLVTSKFDIHA